MVQTALEIGTLDPVWDKMVLEAQCALEKEPLLGAMIHSSILHHSSLDSALSYQRGWFECVFAGRSCGGTRPRSGVPQPDPTFVVF